jgi:hypothetical protein
MWTQTVSGRHYRQLHLHAHQRSLWSTDWQRPPFKIDTILSFQYISVWLSYPTRTENDAPYLINVIFLFVLLSPVPFLFGSTFLVCWRATALIYALFYLVLKCFPTWRMEYMALISFVLTPISYFTCISFHLMLFDNLISLYLQWQPKVLHSLLSH